MKTLSIKKLFSPLILWLGLFLALFSFSIEAAEKAPLWIDGVTPFYSEEEYLTGVGIGGSRKEAEDQAYAAISRIFRADVLSETRETERFRQGEEHGLVKTKRTINLNQITQVSTKKVLENVRLSEHWVEPKTQTHYALATLFRPQAAASLTEKIQGMDKEIQRGLRQADKESRSLMLLKAFRRAEQLLLHREAYNTDLRIVQRSGKGIAPPISLIKLQERIDHFLATNLLISVTASGSRTEALRSALIEGLSQQGFHIQKGEKPGDLLVRAKGDFQEADLQNPQFKFIRWEVQLDLVEGKSGKIIGSVRRSGREGHITLPEAKVRARHAMQREVSGPLLAELFKVLEGPEKGE